MNVYILSVSDLTSNYHSSGGLVVFVSDLDMAKLRVAACPDPSAWDEKRHLGMPTNDEWAKALVVPVDSSWQPTEADKTVLVFPDAGCC